MQRAEGGRGGAKLSLHALSRRGSRATGCQCSLWERHASRKKGLSPLKSTQEDLFPRISYLGNLHHSSTAECLFGNKKMRCGPKSALSCRLRSRKFEEAPEAAAGSGTKGRAGWAGGPAGVCCLCLSSSTGCGAVRYQGFSFYNTKGSARSASAEVGRKCVMLTVYFALIGFRPSF